MGGRSMGEVVGPAGTPELGEWLREIPGTTAKISVQKSAVLGTAAVQESQIPSLKMEF